MKLTIIVLTLTGVRDKLLNSIPYSMKIGIPAGIGLFLMFIGLQNAGIVVDNQSTLVTVGNLKDIKVLLAIFGFLLMVVLYIFKVKGAILFSILIVTVVSIFIGLTPIPNKILSMPPSIEPILFKMDFSKIFNIDFIIITIVLLFMDIFNTIGTLIGVASRAKLLEKDGSIKRAKGAFMADAIGTTAGAAVGVTTVTAYVESVTGVEAGGRTGFTAVIIAILFLLATFFSPLVTIIPSYATAPALIFVGILMFTVVKEIDTSDLTEFIPAVITMIIMPLTYNIATGIEFGVLSYVLIKLFTGQIKNISIIMVILAILFIIKEIIVAF